MVSVRRRPRYFHYRDPSGMTLTDDIGLTSLALGVERIELLLEPFVGRFSGVNRAAGGRRGSPGISPRHGALAQSNEGPAAARKRDPSGVPLARDVGLTGLALRVERVEL